MVASAVVCRRHISEPVADASRHRAAFFRHTPSADRGPRGQVLVRGVETQGKVERFHGSMERALDCRGVPAADHQLWLDAFRREHNHIRPHEALQMQTPASRWQPSPRSYQPNPPAWQYPEGAWTLKVDNHGTVDIRERPYRVSKALTGERVRILPVEDRYLIYYCNTLIRELDPATGRATLIDRLVEGQPPAHRSE